MVTSVLDRRTPFPESSTLSLKPIRRKKCPAMSLLELFCHVDDFSIEKRLPN